MDKFLFCIWIICWFAIIPSTSHFRNIYSLRFEISTLLNKSACSITVSASAFVFEYIWKQLSSLTKSFFCEKTKWVKKKFSSSAVSKIELIISVVYIRVWFRRVRRKRYIFHIELLEPKTNQNGFKTSQFPIVRSFSFGQKLQKTLSKHGTNCSELIRGSCENPHNRN